MVQTYIMSGMKSDFTTKIFTTNFLWMRVKQYEAAFTEYRFVQLNTQHYKFK